MLKKLINFLEYFKVVDISNKPVPCMECGACCAYFKVEFDRVENPQVPWSKINIKSGIASMKGVEEFKGRCESLNGEVGKICSCSIYAARPDICEKFPVWLPNGKQNPKCKAARKYHGLKPEIES